MKRESYMPNCTVVSTLCLLIDDGVLWFVNHSSTDDNGDDEALAGEELLQINTENIDENWYFHQELGLGSKVKWEGV